MLPVRATVLAGCALLLSVGPALAQANTVLVVANNASPDSRRIARHYLAARGIPENHLLRLDAPTAETITRADFEGRIQAPIAEWLASRSAQDDIRFIVLTKGIPLRISGTPGRTGTEASVDSELALLYRRLAGTLVAAAGPVPNPYFLGDAPASSAKAFSHVDQDIYLVTRLDGFTVTDVLALIDRGVAAGRDGRFVLDGPADADDQRNRWLASAGRELAAIGLGERVEIDATARVLRDQRNVLGYASWGSNDPAMNVRQPGLSFAPGGLAVMFLSSDARTFSEPRSEWRPGGRGAQASFAGSTQSLDGDLIRAGATGVAGQVSEPFLDGTVRPDIVFAAYVSGRSLAEAFYLGTPSLGWKTIVVGDPLCSPFSKAEQTIEPPPLDPATELPALFAGRKLAVMAGHGEPDALKHLLRAESRLAHRNPTGARESLEQAVAIDPKLDAAWRTLAVLYDQAGEFQKANEVYRRLLDVNAKDVLALNNLAYSVAVHEGQPKDALPLAERAMALAPRNATIADTLGWIRHLTGDDAGALPLLEGAARALPSNAEVQLHVAVVYVAVGNLRAAARAIESVERLDPRLKDRPEFAAVRRAVGGSR